jgi:hypothetical protein
LCRAIIISIGGAETKLGGLLCVERAQQRTALVLS